MVSREELYELVWSTPMIKVAEKFTVSGSYMARVCSALHVPRPERGYWAMLAVGKRPRNLPEGLGWMTFAYPSLGSRLFLPLALYGLAGSLLMIGWLLVRGVDEERWKAVEAA